ncbi:MAG: NfeD family protein [Burkholderiaceae bacterium]
MDVQYYWWLLAIGLVVAELFTGTFYLMILALGAAGAGLAALYGYSLTIQVMAAAAVSILGWAALSVGRGKKDAALPADRNPDVVMDVGATIRVDQWQSARQTKVRYRGAQWSVELSEQAGGDAIAGNYKIESVRGSTLIVRPE